jgi:translation elongation factor aEF-1 beta
LKAHKGVFIAEYDVAVDIKIYIQDPAKIDSVKKALESIVKVRTVTEQDVGFGIKVLKATILLSDAEGGMDSAEEKIRKIPDVSEIEIENITRV